MTPLLLTAADGDGADAGQQADAPHVVMQMLAADADVAERSPAGPDAVGEPPQSGKGKGERQPAQQGRALSRAEFLVVCAVDCGGRWGEACHIAALPRTARGNPQYALGQLGPRPADGPDRGGTVEAYGAG